MSAPTADSASVYISNSKNKNDRGTLRCAVCSTSFGSAEEVLDHEWSCRSSSAHFASTQRAVPSATTPTPNLNVLNTPPALSGLPQAQMQRIPPSLAGFRFGGQVLAQTLPMPLPPLPGTQASNAHPFPYTNAGWSGILPGPAQTPATP